MKKIIYLLLTVFSLSVVSCSTASKETERVQEEFVSLLKSDLSSAELIKALTEFETNNVNHFESKLVLGEYYFSTQNYLASWQYLQKALPFVQKLNTLKDKDKADDYALLYRMLGTLCYLTNDFNQALEYCKKSLDAITKGSDPAGLSRGQVLYLTGHIFFENQNYEDARKYFDMAFTEFSDLAKFFDYTEYIELLVKNGEEEKAASHVETLLEKNWWALGAAGYAGNFYLNNNDYGKALPLYFIQYETDMAYVQSENLPSFTEYLRTIMGESSVSEIKTKEHDLLNLLSFLSGSEREFQGNWENCLRNSFVNDYCLGRYMVEVGTISSAQFEQLISLEKYFLNYQPYYLSLWKAAKTLFSKDDRLADFIPALKKAILLGSDNSYGQEALRELQLFTGTDLDPETLKILL